MSPAEPVSPLIAFFRGEGSDHRGRTLDEILAWDDDAFERHHDFIQWLFPLEEASAFSSNAPRLTAADRDAFRDQPALRASQDRALSRMLAFYGFEREGERIVPAPSFEGRAASWVERGNHNYLRLTRMLRSLVLLDALPSALRLLQALEDLYQRRAEDIGEMTLSYWQDALVG